MFEPFGLLWLCLGCIGECVLPELTLTLLREFLLTKTDFKRLLLLDVTLLYCAQGLPYLRNIILSAVFILTGRESYLSIPTDFFELKNTF